MEEMAIENIGTLIGTIGFPSLIAIILLRSVLGNFNQRLDDLDKRLLQLNKSILLVDKTLNHLTRKDFVVESEFNKSTASPLKKENRV
ncbi:hypothetical protein [Paenibacillus polysaccharolyticus]|uniref:hypothetical protein n=1 Tax=Paenibacillus polysaccharolyticus TaxID=582692 RepID=UPI00280B5745|nr:hypothetical protein [Paenibacillus polysaccharolyticus]